MKFRIIFLSVLFLYLFLNAYSSDWPIYKGNLYFTGNNDEIIVKNNSLKWLFMASNYIFNPIVSDGKVYFSDLDKIIYCVDEETGKPVWKIDMMSVSGHFASFAGVAGKVKYPIVKDNFLFLSDSTAIYCFDKRTGHIVWARAGLQESEKKVAVIDGIYSDPIVSGNGIYYGTRKNFIARDVLNGHVMWTNCNLESYGGFSTYFDNKIFAQSRDYKKNFYSIFCLDQYNGNIIWQKQIDNPLQIFSPVVYQEKVFMPSGKKLFCLSISNGSQIWVKEFDDYLTSNPGFTDREIIITLNNRKIVILMPDDGSVRYDLDFGQKSSPFFVTVRDQLYAVYNYTKQVGGKDIVFSSVRAFQFGNANPIWEFQPPFPGGSSQPSASRGVIFVPAGNYLYAVGTYYDHPITFGNDGNSDTLTLADTNKHTEDKPETYSTQTDTNGMLSQKNEPEQEKIEKKETNKISEETNIKPGPVNLQKVKKGENIVVPNIYFEFNKAYLLRQSILTLNDIVDQLRKNPDIRLEIQGYTDNVGDIDYNLRLSEKRADAVMEYLIKNGVSPERLRSRGFGIAKPIADNKTPEGRSKNRRTEFLIFEK